MSIKRDMKIMSLEKKTIVQGTSGQQKETWCADRTIDVAIYTVSGSVMYSSNTKFNQSTNTGLTLEKAIQVTEKENGNRINDNGTIYKINFVNTAGRYTQLLLEKVM